MKNDLITSFKKNKIPISSWTDKRKIMYMVSAEWIFAENLLCSLGRSAEFILSLFDSPHPNLTKRKEKQTKIKEK